MHTILLDLSDYDGAAAITTAVSAAFSSSGAMIKTLGAGVLAAVVGWFLVLAWTRLWNTEWTSKIFRSCQLAAALIAGFGAFLIVATFQGEDYTDNLEERIDLALGGNADWKREAFDSVRAEVSSLGAGGGSETDDSVVTLKSRSDVVILAERVWDAVFDAANDVPGLPFRLDQRLSPGANPDAANVVFPAEVTLENQWADDARQSVVKYWRNQTDDWVTLQFKGLRLPVALIVAALLGLILAVVATLAWQDIRA